MTFSPNKPIAIIGMGIIGTKVAWACARAGLTTHLYDIDYKKAKTSRDLALGWSEGDEQEKLRGNLIPQRTLTDALENAQLAFENVPEDLSLKRQVLSEIGDLLDDDAFMGSNASSITCTPLALASGRTESFFNMNFTDPRHSSLVELMTCNKTSSDTISFARDFARAIGMVPILVRKEQLGYSFNRLWRVIKKEVLRQIDQGFSTPEDIDRAWMLMFGTDMGPCGLMDDVGLHTVLAVERIYYEESGEEADRPPASLVELIEHNQLGVTTGSGYYNYPEPAFARKGFLDGNDASTEEQTD